jgi:hypothetical protein
MLNSWVAAQNLTGFGSANRGSAVRASSTRDEPTARNRGDAAVIGWFGYMLIRASAEA